MEIRAIREAMLQAHIENPERYKAYRQIAGRTPEQAEIDYEKEKQRLRAWANEINYSDYP